MLGADCLATGHYARVVHGTNGQPHRLYRAVDQRKDQSYVLYTMDQDQLGYITFPLGNLIKPEVRQLARTFGLPVAEKEESQEICFVGKGSYADFVAKRRPDVTRPGEIVTTDGATIGQHKGLVHHTIGQRKGIGVPRPEPLYALRLDLAENRLVVGSRSEAEAARVTAENVSLTQEAWPELPIEITVSVRYRGTPMPATVTFGTDAARSATIEFDADRPIAAPGQAVVFYDGDEVLGGGTIATVQRAWEGAEAMVAG
jgi:tRNA-specific 2-thiouridylase